MKKLPLILLILLFPLLAFAQSQHPVDVFLFHQDSCPHCQEMKLFLANLARNNDAIKVNAYEVSSDINNQTLFIEMAKAYNITANGLPTLFIGNKAIEGNYQTEVENAINNCVSLGCDSPMQRLENYTKIKKSDTSIDSDLMKLRWFILILGIFIILFLIYFSRRKRD